MIKQLTEFDITRILTHNKYIRLILINQYRLLGQEKLADNILLGNYFVLEDILNNIQPIITKNDHRYKKVTSILNYYSSCNKKFPGFSVNYEIDYYQIAKALFEDNKYINIIHSIEELDSHFPMIEIYKKELGQKAWSELEPQH